MCNCLSENIVEVKIKLLYEDSILPEKAHENDACYDVYAHSKEYKNGLWIYKLGFATEIPEGWEGILKPRSSFTKTFYVMQNSPGTIDSGFRNEWQIRFRSILCDMDYPPYPPYEIGDRVAQVNFNKIPKTTFKQVDVLDDTERGLGGFGSTGK
jgi:dUTP pyrophosphatase